MDNFFRYVIYGFLGLLMTVFVIGFVGGCSMGGQKEADLVEDMADNCKRGMKRGSVKRDDDDTEVIVECSP